MSTNKQANTLVDPFKKYNKNAKNQFLQCRREYKNENYALRINCGIIVANLVRKQKMFN